MINLPMRVSTIFLKSTMVLLAVLYLNACLAATNGNARALTKGKVVTAATFIRAETDRTFSNYCKLADINTFFHYRKPTPLDKQGVIRMNRDTLYSGAVVDTRGGASLIFPQVPEGRYVSAMVIDNDHYVPAIYHSAGKHQLPDSTRYIFVVLRVQVFDPSDADEIALINQLQNQFQISASNAQPFPEPQWDMASLMRLQEQYNREFARFDRYPSDWAGAKGQVNEATRHLAAAGAWGLLPEWEATYINYNVGRGSAGQCYTATYQIPENKAFWSITMYGEDGKIQHENAVLNSSNARLNEDSTLTVYFGSQAVCSEQLNRLDTGSDWNFLMRVYRPGESVLNGDYTLPEVVPMAGKKAASPSDFGVSNLAYRVSESDVYIRKHLAKAGVNQFAHQRDFVNVKTQQVIRENQDILYSSAVADVRRGLTITVPEYDAYSIVQVIDMQNYSIATVYAGQSVEIKPADLSYGNYVYLNARTQPPSLDAGGFEQARAQQNGLLLEADSAEPYESPDLVMDAEDLLVVRTALIQDVADGRITDFTRLMGTSEFVDEQGHLYATAFGWGGLPSWDAGYLTVPVEVSGEQCAYLTIDPPPLDYARGGFWSLTAYNETGWLAHDKAAVSSRQAQQDDDRRYTIRFNCPDQPNNITTETIFSVLLRFYVPTSLDAIRAYLAHSKSSYVIKAE